MKQELQTVSQVSKELGLSTRMLRYYERIGLVESTRMGDYAYRVYDDAAVARLRQIVILRKLRVSLKQIKEILEDPSAAAAISVFQQNVSELGNEIDAMSALRDVLTEFLGALKAQAWLPAKSVLLDDETLLDMVHVLSPSKTRLQEERASKMEEMEHMEETMSRLKDVRIVYLPPATVASAHFVGDDPENQVGAWMAEFVRSSRLGEKYPAMRHYGFNHPNPVDESNFHGYEMWATIPEDMDVPQPLTKKSFAGGMYAAHMIQMGNFYEWMWLEKWVNESEEYVYNGSGSPENMFGSLEEHLNYFSHIQETPEGEPVTTQLDLLIPVRKK